jgi:hypothetical protein
MQSNRPNREIRALGSALTQVVDELNRPLSGKMGL